MVRTQLQPFTTSAPRATTPDDLGELALHTHRALRAATTRSLQPPAGMATLDRSVQRTTNLLPQLSDDLAVTLDRLATIGELHAHAHQLRFREERIGEHLAKTPIIATRFDLADARRALTAAGDRAAELAVTLTRSAGRPSDQPGLLAAHTARAEQARTRTTADQLTAALVNAVAPAALTDPYWPVLARTLTRLQQDGIDVPALLNQAARTSPMPTGDPARTLDQRLRHAAAVPDLRRSESHTEADRPTATPSPRPDTSPHTRSRGGPRR